jgi:carboxymethylenebutenolidase
MGGGMALTAAGYYPDRVAAAASFHGGNLATELPTSPHLVVPQIKAEVYVAGADKDHGYPPEMAQRFEAALTKAGVRHKCELFEGKMHGWMKPDMPSTTRQRPSAGGENSSPFMGERSQLSTLIRQCLIFRRFRAL